jgi:SET domain
MRTQAERAGFKNRKSSHHFENGTMMTMGRSSKLPRWLLVVSLCILQQSLQCVSRVNASSNEGECAQSSNDETCDCSDETTRTDEDEFVCGLYLARSMIPNSGLGMFSGVNHNVGDVVAPPEIAHQILLEFSGLPADHVLQAYPNFGTSLAHHYTWSSFVSGGNFESSYVETLIPGVGMAANSFSPLVNSRSIMGKSIDTAGLYSDGTVGPGAGAFSAYHGMTYVADVVIEQGEEIFADYGDAYFRGRPDAYGMIPLTDEFHRADEMIKALWGALPAEKDKVDLTKWQSVWDTIREQFVEDERTRNALPEKAKDLRRAAHEGAARFYLGGRGRSPDWLESNGYCMDTLSIQPSSIPDAGRGAFAKKRFAAGERILPLPLLQIPRESLHIYSTRRENISEKKDTRHQLLMNYCFGVAGSSMLLMPYSSAGNFINHANSTSANAKVVWAVADSDPTDFHKEDWMMLSSAKILQKSHTGLLMHVVATREIARGEEVTIDYGEDWERTWNDHVASWSQEDAHLSASELNTVETEIRTVFEDPYPEGVMTACHYRYGGTPDERNAPNNPNNQQNGDQLQVDFIEKHAFRWIDYGGRSTINGEYFRPCRVVARHLDSKEGSVYTVEVGNRDDQPQWDQIPSNYQHFVKNVPRRAMMLVDEPYTSHQHYEMAFRHEIGFPNAEAMWPLAWMDGNE